MVVLSVTHNFAPNTLAEADQVDQNFTDIVTWANTNAIQKDASLAFTAIPSGPASDATSDNQFMRNAFIARGVITASGTGTDSHTGTISFGKTFSVPPIPIGTVRSASGVRLCVRWLAAPTTTSVDYAVVDVDGAGFSAAYFVYWMAIPVEP